jgi:hypothetical protein
MNKRNTSLFFFRNSSSASAFSDGKTAESLPCSFFCCVFYTRQIGNYVCFIVFSWIFRKNCTGLYIALSFSLPPFFSRPLSLFPLFSIAWPSRTPVINSKASITFSPSFSYQFACFNFAVFGARKVQAFSIHNRPISDCNRALQFPQCTSIFLIRVFFRPIL